MVNGIGCHYALMEQHFLSHWTKKSSSESEYSSSESELVITWTVNSRVGIVSFTVPPYRAILGMKLQTVALEWARPPLISLELQGHLVHFFQKCQQERICNSGWKTNYFWDLGLRHKKLKNCGNHKDKTDSVFWNVSKLQCEAAKTVNHFHCTTVWGADNLALWFY